jgi:hypothetical protein
MRWFFLIKTNLIYKIKYYDNDEVKQIYIENFFKNNLWLWRNHGNFERSQIF